MTSKQQSCLNFALILSFLISAICVNAQHFISGNISTESERVLENVYVTISGSIEESVLTDENGYYEFLVPEGGNYVITPCYNADPINGVSTYDLLLIMQHNEGTSPLTSPYTLIAANVDQNETVDILDEQLHRLIIEGGISVFPNNKSWRFVDKSFDFPDASNPFSTIFPEEGIVNNLANDIIIDFTGIKLGDLNDSSALAFTSNAEDISLVCFPVITSSHLISDNVKGIKAFPNPFENEFSIQLNKVYSEVSIEIYASAGQKISNKTYYNVDLINTDLNNEVA